MAVRCFLAHFLNQTLSQEALKSNKKSEAEMHAKGSSKLVLHRSIDCTYHKRLRKINLLLLLP